MKKRFFIPTAVIVCGLSLTMLFGFTPEKTVSSELCYTTTQLTLDSWSHTIQYTGTTFGAGPLYYSTDGGTTWAPAPSIPFNIVTGLGTFSMSDVRFQHHSIFNPALPDGPAFGVSPC